MKYNKRFTDTYRNAINGIIYAFRSQKNFKIQFSFAVVAIFLSTFFAIDSREWLAVIFCIVLVLAAECFNTALEVFSDFVHPQQNEKIKIIKDVSAGAVLILSIGALTIGSIIFLPKIYCLFTS